jgi:hypothetical protein
MASRTALLSCCGAARPNEQGKADCHPGDISSRRSSSATTCFRRSESDRWQGLRAALRRRARLLRNEICGKSTKAGAVASAPDRNIPRHFNVPPTPRALQRRSYKRPQSLAPRREPEPPGRNQPARSMKPFCAIRETIRKQIVPRRRANRRAGSSSGGSDEPLLSLC